MLEIQNFGKLLLIAGGILIIVGAVLILSNKIPFIGRLPGDIYIQRKNFTFYFPVVTSILISVVLSIIFWLWSKR